VPSLSRIIFHGLPGFSAYIGLSPKDYTAALGLRILLENSVYTILRYILGIFGGIILGFGFGILLGKNQMIYKIIEFPFDFARSLPLLGFIPIFLVWFGDAELGKILYILWSVIIIIMVATVQAIQNVPPVYKQFARTLGASEGEVYHSVVIPAIIPELVGTVRVVLGFGWGLVLAAEFIASQKGLGHLAILSQRFFFPERLVIITVLFIIFSLAANIIFLILANRILRWQPR
jgi:sulfonate transport system permease protein